jgi:hypothetical protein
MISAAKALGRLKAKEVALLLKSISLKGDGHLQYQLYCGILDALALGKMGSQKHAKKISKLLEDSSFNKSWIIQSSLKAIGMLKAQKYAKKVYRLLNDQDNGIRSLAILTLGELGATDYKNEITTFIDSNNISIKGSAIKTLGQLNAREFSDEIKKLLSDESKCSIYDFKSDSYIQTALNEIAAGALNQWKNETK